MPDAEQAIEGPWQLLRRLHRELLACELEDDELVPPALTVIDGGGDSDA